MYPDLGAAVSADTARLNALHAAALAKIAARGTPAQAATATAFQRTAQAATAQIAAQRTADAAPGFLQQLANTVQRLGVGAAIAGAAVLALLLLPKRR